jgi:hypothetical protein
MNLDNLDEVVDETVKKALLFDLKDLNFESRVKDLIAKGIDVKNSIEIVLRAQRYEERMKKLKAEALRNKTLVEGTYVITFDTPAQYHQICDAIRVTRIKRKALIVIWRDKDGIARVMIRGTENDEKAVKLFALKDRGHVKNIKVRREGGSYDFIHYSKNSNENLKLLAVEFARWLKLNPLPRVL